MNTLRQLLIGTGAAMPGFATLNWTDNMAVKGKKIKRFLL